MNRVYAIVVESSTRHAPIILTTMENCLENFEKIGTFLIKNPKIITFFLKLADYWLIWQNILYLEKNILFLKKIYDFPITFPV